MKALLGKKRGMTRVFDTEGRQIPVTVIEAGPCVVVQVKSVERDGYRAVQLGYDGRPEKRASKPELGHTRKHGSSPVRRLVEVPVGEDETPEPGQTVTVSMFESIGHVDVSALSKGKGFQGVMKRHGMSGQPASHGHTMHRRTGAIGMGNWPGRILKGTRLPGHMGDVRVTTQNLQVIQVRPDDHALLVKGSVPGPVGGYVMVRQACKKTAGVK